MNEDDNGVKFRSFLEFYKLRMIALTREIVQTLVSCFLDFYMLRYDAASK